MNLNKMGIGIKKNFNTIFGIILGIIKSTHTKPLNPNKSVNLIENAISESEVKEAFLEAEFQRGKIHRHIQTFQKY